MLCVAHALGTLGDTDIAPVLERPGLEVALQGVSCGGSGDSTVAHASERPVEVLLQRMRCTDKELQSVLGSV